MVIVLVFVGWVIDGFLGGGCCMYGGYQVVFDVLFVVDDFGQWGQIVGGV